MPLNHEHLQTVIEGRTPVLKGLLPGQIAINLVDRKLFIGDGSDVRTRTDNGTEPTVAGRGFFEGYLSPIPPPPPNVGPTVAILSELTEDVYTPVVVAAAPPNVGPTVAILSGLTEDVYAPTVAAAPPNVGPTVTVLSGLTEDPYTP